MTLIGEGEDSSQISGEIHACVAGVDLTHTFSYPRATQVVTLMLLPDHGRWEYAAQDAVVLAPLGSCIVGDEISLDRDLMMIRMSGEVVHSSHMLEAMDRSIWFKSNRMWKIFNKEDYGPK